MSVTLQPVVIATPTVAGVSINVAPNNNTRLGLFVFNPSSSAVLWVSPLSVPALVAGAGSIAVQPLQGIMLGQPGSMPPWTQGLNAIYATGSGPITVLEFNP